MSVIEDRLRYLDELALGRGSHNAPNNGLVAACVMEAVSYVAGEPFTDHPKCASPILTSFLIRWNDRLDDDARQILKPYIPRLVGTNTGRPEDELTRRYMLADWLVHESLPGLLRQAQLTDQAVLLEQLVEVTDATTYTAARSALASTRNVTWEKRKAWRAELRRRVEEELAKRGPADAAAVAAAAAAAVAVADADAAAVAVADAAAVAVAVAVADADAAAVAVAVAVADTDYSSRYDAAYEAAYEVLKPIYAEKLGEINKGLQTSALRLLDRLIEVGRVPGTSGQ